MLDEAMVALRRFFRRHLRSGPASPAGSRTGGPLTPLALTLGFGLVLALVLIGVLELRLRPIVEQLAVHQVGNRITRDIHQAVLADLEARNLTYGELITIERDGAGAITALSSNMAKINQLRSQVVNRVLDAVEGIDPEELGVPLGSLFDFDLLWALGPTVQVRGLTAGTVSADVQSSLVSSGINQSVHRLMVHIQVPLTVLLPGGNVKTEVVTDICVAETVIVGKVPDTYLQVGTDAVSGLPGT